MEVGEHLLVGVAGVHEVFTEEVFRFVGSCLIQGVEGLVQDLQESLGPFSVLYRKELDYFDEFGVVAGPQPEEEAQIHQRHHRVTEEDHGYTD